MEKVIDDEEFLSLKLAVTTGYGKRRRKREKNQDCHSSKEDKILKLLHVREQMLKHNQTREGVSRHADHLHLIHLLLVSATCVRDNNGSSALDHLCKLYQSVCLTGDSIQRVAAYFADGLAARLLTQRSPFYSTVMNTPMPGEAFTAFLKLYRASPLYQFAHFTANQAILEAFEREEDTNNRALHVIDFNVCYGFQWPSLMQALSENATTTRLKITGFARNVEELRETESRLVTFAKDYCNLVFEFQGLVRGSKLVKPNKKKKKKKNETVAINLAFYMNSLNSYSKISETLKQVYLLNPSIVVLGEFEGIRNPHKFLPRFMESLHYFTAIFDSLADCFPCDSFERLSIEKYHLGKEINRIINYDTEENKCPGFETMETWKRRMVDHGFGRLKQSSKSVIQAKLLLKIRSNCSAIKFGEDTGFRVSERDDGQAISLGWQERLTVLFKKLHNDLFYQQEQHDDIQEIQDIQGMQMEADHYLNYLEMAVTVNPIDVSVSSSSGGLPLLRSLRSSRVFHGGGAQPHDSITLGLDPLALVQAFCINCDGSTWTRLKELIP